MIFTFVMGNIVDHYDAIGDTGAVLTVGAITLFVLTVLHSATLIFSKEKPAEKKESTPALLRLKETLKNKRLIKVCIMLSLFNVAHNVSTPFYGSYQIKELGFSMTFVSVLSAIYSVVRTAFSRPLGKFADKYSFLKMLNVCYIIILAAYTVNIFTVPENGKIVYTIYYALFAISYAGINSGTMNIVFECADKERRVESLALAYTLYGLVGFFTTLLASPLVSYIQKNGNMLFGLHVYGQQVLALISFVLTVIAMLFTHFVIEKQKVMVQ
jgi:MFS family permease